MNQIDLSRTLIMERRFSYNIFDSLPKERGDYRPQDGMMTAAEQIAHIGACEEWLVQGLQHENWSFDTFDDRPEKTIEEALAFLDYSRKRFLALIEDLKDEGLQKPVGPNPSFSTQMYVGNVLLIVLPHECHHRGQLVVYLRMMGITPPNLYATT